MKLGSGGAGNRFSRPASRQVLLIYWRLRWILGTFWNATKIGRKSLVVQCLAESGARLFHEWVFFGAALADAGFVATGAVRAED